MLFRSSLGYLEMQYYRAKLLITATQGKAIDATQALNYCKHKIVICQEAMAGTHSLKCCFKPPVYNCKWFVESKIKLGTKFQILVEVSTKRESSSQGASFVCKDQMRNQIVVRCHSWLAKKKFIVLSQTIHESSTHALIKGVVAQPSLEI